MEGGRFRFRDGERVGMDAGVIQAWSSDAIRSDELIAILMAGFCCGCELFDAEMIAQGEDDQSGQGKNIVIPCLM